jgi:rare lipoprotein A (peptidoglycan hydrolase)
MVRLNDHGLYVDSWGRVIDLPRAAARRLGLEGPGLASMHVVVEKDPNRLTHML